MTSHGNNPLRSYRSPRLRHFVFVELPITGSAVPLVVAAHEAGHAVTVLGHTPSRYAQVLQKVQQQYPEFTWNLRQVDTENEKAVLQVIQSSQTPIAGVFCMSDFCIEQAATLAQTFSTPFFTPDAIRTLVNKERCFSLLREMHIPVPDTLKFQGAISGKCILKTSRGSGSMGVRLHQSGCDVQELLHEVQSVADLNRGQVLVQEYVVGCLCSAEILITQAFVHVLGFTSRDYTEQSKFQARSATFPFKPPADICQSLEGHIHQLVQHLKMSAGMLHVEFVYNRHGLKIIEINPRPPGALFLHMIQAALGIDIFRLLIDIHVGQPVNLPPAQVQRFTALGMLYASTAGKLISCDTEEAQRYFKIEKLAQHKFPGAELTLSQDFNDRILTLMTVSGDPVDATLQATQALHHVNVTISPAHSSTRGR